jgi:broad specificity phosphatase PhoE
MALFYFIRHGETEWNAAGRLCGRTDVPLSDVGRRQAQLLAVRLKPIPFEALYSSPLRRALETASILGHAIGREAVADPRLLELSYGAWEGRTSDEIKRANPDVYRAWEQDPASVAPPEGESGEQLIERLKPFLADVEQRHLSGNVVVVCHRTVCRLLACHIMGVPISEYRKRIPMDNGALNIFETMKGKWHVVALNDSSHLSSALAEPASTLQGE